MHEPSDVPVFILCGGLGTRLKEETEFRPKPMVPIGGRPILWHIMRWYHGHGFRRFILCLGLKGEVIKEYFLHLYHLNNDFTVDLSTNAVVTHWPDTDFGCEVTLADTGETSMTGSRLAIAAERYLREAEHFALTYGDGLTDANLAAEFAFHQDHGKLGTILGVNPPSRFGEIHLDGSAVAEFAEKPDIADHWINGGYFLFRRGFIKYLSKSTDCVLEREPLVRLARDGELAVFKHRGFWGCMDTQRDREHLNHLWASGQAPWRVQPRES